MRARLTSSIFWMAISLIVVGLSPDELRADVSNGKAVETKSSDGFPAEPDPEKQQLATIATYLLIIVAVAGVSLVILVMLWGSRVRRQVRQSLPGTSPADPLWYLKKKLREPSASPNESEGQPNNDNSEDKPNSSDG